MSEIEKAIKHFENMRDDNFVVLDKFKKEIESGKVNGITTVYDNRHLYYSLAIEALKENQEREKGCEYCNGDSLNNLVLTHTFDKPRVSLHGGNTDIDELEKPIFCPKCGRKLGENNG